MKRPRLPAYLIGLGALLLFIVAAEVGIIYFFEESLEAVYVVFVAAMLPFTIALVAGGVWLWQSHLPERRYKRIGGWTAGGLIFWGGLFLVVGAMMMPVEELVGAVRWGIGVGAGSGVLIGLFEARAIENERVAERRRIREHELEQRTDRLEEFASIVSHDLRNPLTVAMGRLDLARAENDNEHLQTIDSALQRVEVILTDTLDLARHGQVITEPEPVTLAYLAESAWENVDTKEGTLELEGSVELEGDPERLGQVFENLFRNAIEHGGDTVIVRIGTLPNNRGFYIEDDGPGVPDADRDTIFHPGESAKTEGTGFGLTIVRSIVAAHDWEITVSDGRDGGARFEVRQTNPGAGRKTADPDHPAEPIGQ